MNNDAWAQLCRTFGYEINRMENGVILPWKLHLACQLAVPLHRGNHDRGEAEHMSYPDKTKKLVAKVLDKAKAGAHCSDPDGSFAPQDQLMNACYPFAMAVKKANLEEFQQLALEFGKDFTSICNATNKSLKKVPAGPELLEAINKAEAKITQYDQTLAKLGDTHARQWRDEYDEHVDLLRQLLDGMRAKQAKG